MQYRATVIVEASIHPTEHPGKVTRCIQNIFPEADIEIDEEWREKDGIDRALAETHSVESLRNQINQQRINNSLKKELSGSVIGDTISFKIRKQPAYIGKINIGVGGHELGDISIRIETNDPSELIDYITKEE